MSMPMPVYTGGFQKMTQVRFLGYDVLGTDGAICDMKNLTSDYLPELSVRPQRLAVRSMSAPNGFWANGQRFCWVNGGTFFDGGLQVGPDDWLDSTTEKTMAAMGDRLVIFPDKKFYDLVSMERGNLEAEVSVEGAGFASEELAYSSRNNVLLCPGADLYFLHEGDAVEISGCAVRPGNNITAVIREKTDTGLVFLDDTFELQPRLVFYVTKGELGPGDYCPDVFINGQRRYFTVSADESVPEGGCITIDVPVDTTEAMTAVADCLTHSFEMPVQTGAQGTELAFVEDLIVPYTETGTVTIRRAVPDMDFVFGHNNRLFGCRGDTIYVSKLGDVTNWNVFDGTAADSWATDTGTPGEFTGACAYGGYPRFFKEDLIFTLYGDYPGAYQLQAYEYMGIANGSGKSLAVVNGRLYYLSDMGPCVFAGGAPSLLADAFGTDRYEAGVGGGDGGVKYYLSMRRKGAGDWHLFVYDSRKGVWMREDDTQALGMGSAGGMLYCLAAAGEFGAQLLALGAYDPSATIMGGTVAEDAVEWHAEFGDFTDSLPNWKKAGKLQIRLEMEEGSVLWVKLKYDSTGDWQEIARVECSEKKSFVLPVIPRRVDHYRLRLEGKGGCRISSIARQVAAGSER